jgi:hypothetical protein
VDFLPPMGYIIRASQVSGNITRTRDGGTATSGSHGMKTAREPFTVGFCAGDSRCYDDGKNRCELHYALFCSRGYEGNTREANRS